MNEIIECDFCDGRGWVKRRLDKPIEVCPRCKGKKGTPIFPDDFPPRPWIILHKGDCGFRVVSKTGQVIADNIKSRYVARILANTPPMYAALKKIHSMKPGENYDETCDIYTDCSTCDQMIKIAGEALEIDIFKSVQQNNGKE